MGTIITLIIWAAVLQGFLLGVIFITSKKHGSLANKLLGCFLIAFVFQALTDILPYNEIGGYSIVGYFTLPEVKWFLPLLFLHFVLVKVQRYSTYRLFLKINYVLAFGMIGITGINILLVVIHDATIMDILGWELADKIYMSFQYYAFFLTIAAFAIALYETKRYSQRVKNESSDLTMLNISWLWQFIFLMAPIIIFWGAELIRIAMGGRGQSDLTTLVFLFIAVFNYFVSYKAFTHQTLFDGSVDRVRTYKNAPAILQSSQGSLDPEIYEKIESEMESNRYYLDQNMTIHELAKQIQIPARTISTYVNQSAGCNFNEWINNYRVDHALATLQDKKMDHYSIEGIGSDSGFKSRSSMYMAFKKRTGHSPGHFRKD
jgi:AraC-like DNA-binding protein